MVIMRERADLAARVAGDLAAGWLAVLQGLGTISDTISRLGGEEDGDDLAIDLAHHVVFETALAMNKTPVEVTFTQQEADRLLIRVADARESLSRIHRRYGDTPSYLRELQEQHQPSTRITPCHNCGTELAPHWSGIRWLCNGADCLGTAVPVEKRYLGHEPRQRGPSV
jgi:hypothetical protein